MTGAGVGDPGGPLTSPLALALPTHLVDVEARMAAAIGAQDRLGVAFSDRVDSSVVRPLAPKCVHKADIPALAGCLSCRVPRSP